MKQVLVTGSSRGIGRYTVIELARRGWKVFATMRTPKVCEPFPEEFQDRIVLRHLDVKNGDSISSVVDEMERIDGVVNNAGYGLYSPIELVDEEEFFDQFDVNVFGVLRVMQAVLPKMRAQRSGHIVNVSSIAGVANNPFLGLYCASKHALEVISESLATNVYPWNIKVSVVEPGPVATQFADVMPLSKNLEKESPYNVVALDYLESLRARIREGQPPEEVADLIAEILETEEPHFRYQTSPHVRQVVSQFIKDPDGDRWIDEQKNIF